MKALGRQRLRSLTDGFAALLFIIAAAPCANAQGSLVSWADSSHISEPPTGTFTAVAAGNMHRLAIRTDGTLASWGLDNNGIIEPAPAGNFVAVAAGWAHAVAIRTDGTLVSWGGFDTVGEVSDTPSGTFIAVAAGGYHSVAIRTDGTLESWGNDGSGEVSFTPAGTFTAVAAGGANSVAIRTDGTLVSWGGDYTGQVSDTPSGTFKAVFAGYGRIAAIRTDGTLVVWGGYDFYGELSDTPTGTFVSVAIGVAHNVAIRTDGTLHSWGDDTNGSVSGTPGGTFSAVASSLHGCVAITSSSGNQPPIAVDDLTATTPGTSVVIDVLANDSDPDLDTLTIVYYTDGALGRVTSVGGVLNYEPNDGVTTGLDSFTYTIEASGAQATATVFVNLGVTPHITSLSPDSAMVGTLGPLIVGVSGSNFSKGAKVLVGGASRTTMWVSGTLLAIELSAADLAVVGNLQITVVDPLLPALVSNAANFRVVSPKFRYSATAAMNAFGDVEVTLTIENRSSATAYGVLADPVTLDGVGPSSSLPVSFGNIVAGASVSRTVVFSDASFIAGKKYDLEGTVSTAAFSENFREKVQIGS
jgi:hypothetical protein